MIKSVTKKEDKPKSFGHLNLSSTQFSKVKGLTVNDTMDVKITLKVTGVRKVSDWQIEDGRAKEGDVEVDFEMASITEIEETKAS